MHILRAFLKLNQTKWETFDLRTYKVKNVLTVKISRHLFKKKIKSYEYRS